MPPHVKTSSSQIGADEIWEILRLYCRALSGKDVDVRDAEQLSEKKVGWSHGTLPTTDGSTIFLPALINKFATTARNFALLKVMATYQAALIEFGSFHFAFHRPSAKFGDLRQRWHEVSLRNREAATATPTATEVSRFFRLFSDKRLALDIFTVVESARIEATLMREYRGIAPAYRDIRASALESRPDIRLLPAREALIEFLIRLSLGQTRGLKVPSKHADVAGKLGGVLRRVAESDATVEDAAEATLRIYALLSGIPNERVAPDLFLDLTDKETPATWDEEIDLEQIARELEVAEREQAARPYASPRKVDYRGDFMPELGQLWSQFQLGGLKGVSSNSPALTREQIAELVRVAPELQRDEPDGDGGDQAYAEDLLANLVTELAKHTPGNEEFRQGFMQPDDDEGRSLAGTGAGTFVYDEWDFHAAKYRSHWCLVHEKPMSYGNAMFYFQTLADHNLLAEQIRNEFELIAPEMHRKVRRLQDGEEHDLDAFIEAMTDLRAGVTPSEKLFWRRNKTERSVAAAFLIDMSASTAEPIDEGGWPQQWGPRNDPAPSSALSASRGGAVWPPYKRIIDVEKESIVLLVNSLQLLGDTYGIYGFSGFGRDNVEFYLIKDIDEEFTPDVAKRIDRITPQHATRMGPAIRHAKSKLSRQDAKSKLLFLISDGRPQDRGYSRDGIEKEYAVQDTRMAFLEARHEGITPFCLTVDKSGHDYLHAMMDDFNYEVLHDVSVLPRRLPQLYKKLTS